MIITCIITDIRDSSISQSHSQCESQSEIRDRNNTNNKDTSKKTATTKRKSHEITIASSPRPSKKRKKTHNNLGNTRVSTSSFDKPNAIKTNQVNNGLSNDESQIIFGQNYHKHLVMEYPQNKSIADVLSLLTQYEGDKNNVGSINIAILQSHTIQSILNDDNNTFNLTNNGSNVYQDLASKIGKFEFRTHTKDISSSPKRLFFESIELFNDCREEIKKYQNTQIIIFSTFNTSTTIELLDANLFTESNPVIELHPIISLVFIYIL